MVKRNSLKRSLKASDRRRKKRAGGPGVLVAPSSSEVTTANSPDTTGLIVTSLLSHEPSHDMVAVSAIRSCLSGTLPTGDEAKEVAASINEIQQRDDVSTRHFRESLKELLDVSSEHQSSDDSDGFLTFLKLFV